MKSILKKIAGAVITTAFVFVITGCKPSVEVHEHTNSDDWSFDGEYHWHAATCEHTEAVAGREPHTFGEWSEGKRSCSKCEYEQNCGHTWKEWTIIKQPSEESAGARERICEVCGIVEAEELAKLDHVHRLGTHHAAVQGTCKTKGIVEYYDCAKETCHVKLDKDGNPLDTTDGDLDASNHEETATWTKTAATHKETYECCNAVKTAESAHTWDAGVVTKVATEYAKGEKICTCDVCSTTRTEVIPIWYESPVDAETGNAATSGSKYIYFGVFPKTVLPLDSTVTVDETDSVKMGANTYYRGSDGEYYAKAFENAYGTGADCKYTDGTQAKQKRAGSYRYFKVEPIKWKVLTKDYNGTGNALLLAEDILTANIPYYESISNRTIDGKTVYSNNYKHSQIRAYLNGLTYQGQSSVKETKWNGKGFFQTAFTQAAQSKIVTTTVDNSGASTTDATGYLTKADGSNSSYPTDYTCADTADKVLLLSEKEVTTTAYGFAAYNSYIKGNARIHFPTDYAKANYAFQSPTDGDGVFWWLRSPCYSLRTYARCVSCDGDAYDYKDVIDKQYGVVPALSISL